MPLYPLLWIALFCLASVAVLLNMVPLAMALFPLPVACHWARGDRGKSAGLAACAVLCGTLWLLFPGLLAFGLAACLGIAIGVWAPRLSFGWGVTALTLTVFAALAGVLFAEWPSLPRLMDAFIAAWTGYLGEAAKQDKITVEMQTAGVEAMQWYGAHWREVIIGIYFSAALFFAAATMSLLGRWLALAHARTGTGPVLRGSFRTMRVSEWLVWAAIAAVLPAMAEHRWPNDALRMISWNACIGLAAVYWLNGFSILVFFAAAMRLNPLLAGAGVFLIFWLMMHPMVVFTGLFDTWWDFRRRIREAIAAREANRQDGPRDGNGGGGGA